MANYIVCKVLMGSNNIPKYQPFGYLDSLEKAILFNKNNAENNYIALFDVTNESIDPSLMLSTEVISDNNEVIDNGVPFDTIRNRLDTDLIVGSKTIPASSEIISFWDYHFIKDSIPSLIEQINSYNVELLYCSEVLTQQQAINRLKYMQGVLTSLSIGNEEDRLLWNQFAGNRLILNFRQDIINSGVLDNISAMTIKQKMDFVTGLLNNGQLAESMLALTYIETDDLITPELIQRYISYIKSCYVG